MKKIAITFFIGAFVALFSVPGISATCSVLNLTKCLDSVCAKNIGANPAARCQICGTASAGNASTSSGGLSSLSIGLSSATTISATELKSAPSAPGELYIWASNLCIEKNSGCDASDIEENYDGLIEQSCNAALNNMNFESANEKNNQAKTRSVCSAEIYSCITRDNYCDADFSRCDNSVDFNNFYNSCAATAAKCDEWLTDIRTEMQTVRTNRQDYIESLTKAYQDKREKSVIESEQSCANNAGFNSCVAQVCEYVAPNKCDANYPSESSMAASLCDFHKTACENLGK